MNLASTFVNDPTNSRLKFTRFSEPKAGDTMLAAMPILTAVPALAARVADGGAVLPAVHVRRIHGTATVMDSGLTCPKVQQSTVLLCIVATDFACCVHHAQLLLVEGSDGQQYKQLVKGRDDTKQVHVVGVTALSADTA